MEEGAEEFSWHVLSHEHKEHSVDWYWALGTLAVAGAGLSVFLGNILLAVIIIIAAGSIGVLAARGPREHQVKIDRRGVAIDGTLYPYSSLHSYWIERERENPRLILSTTGFLAPHFALEIGDTIDRSALNNFLKQRVEEEEQGPHIGEHLAEMLGL